MLGWRVEGGFQPQSVKLFLSLPFLHGVKIKFIATKWTMRCEHWLVVEMCGAAAWRRGGCQQDNAFVRLTEAAGSETQRGECEGMTPGIKLLGWIGRWGQAPLSRRRVADAWKSLCAVITLRATFTQASAAEPPPLKMQIEKIPEQARQPPVLRCLLQAAGAQAGHFWFASKEMSAHGLSIAERRRRRVAPAATEKDLSSQTWAEDRDHRRNGPESQEDD